MYFISSGEDRNLLLEQAANTKQSKEIILFRVPYKRSDFGISLLNPKLFCLFVFRIVFFNVSVRE